MGVSSMAIQLDSGTARYPIKLGIQRPKPAVGEQGGSEKVAST
jgi:hypothetical protein